MKNLAFAIAFLGVLACGGPAQAPAEFPDDDVDTLPEACQPSVLKGLAAGLGAYGASQGGENGALRVLEEQCRVALEARKMNLEHHRWRADREGQAEEHPIVRRTPWPEDAAKPLPPAVEPLPPAASDPPPLAEEPEFPECPANGTPGHRDRPATPDWLAGFQLGSPFSSVQHSCRLPLIVSDGFFWCDSAKVSVGFSKELVAIEECSGRVCSVGIVAPKRHNPDWRAQLNRVIRTLIEKYGFPSCTRSGEARWGWTRDGKTLSNLVKLWTDDDRVFISYKNSHSIAASIQRPEHRL